MQFKKKHSPWTKEEKQLALTLYYKSLSTYKFLRMQKVNLPGLLTLCRWIGISNFLPGFSNIFLSHIKKKFEFKTEREKVCCHCFDEISIKQFLKYNKELDFIEGFEDYGHLGRSVQHANTALVFLLRGIYSQ